MEPTTQVLFLCSNMDMRIMQADKINEVCPSTYYGNDLTKQCTQTCPSSPTLTYYDNDYKLCVENCSTNPSRYAYIGAGTNNQSCLECKNTINAVCPSSYYADDTTRKCVTTCPVNTYYHVNGVLRQCVIRCPANTYANLNKTCVAALSCSTGSTVPYFGDDLTNMCVTSCPTGANTYADSTTGRCLAVCSPTFYSDPTTLKCVSDCPTGPPRYYGSDVTKTCVLNCTAGQYADNSTGKCTKTCGTLNGVATFGDNSTRRCVVTCPLSQNTFADTTTGLCVTICSLNFFSNNATQSCVAPTSCSDNTFGDPTTRKCVQALNCPTTPYYFADPTTRLCVTRCPTTAPGYWGDRTIRFCAQTCPWNPGTYVTWKDASTRQCVTTCPVNPTTFSDNVTKECVDTCPSYPTAPISTYADSTTRACVTTCPLNYYAQTSTSKCVSNCLTTTSVLYFYAVNATCISGCPTNYYADNSTMSCVSVCPTNPNLYAYQAVCRPDCPTGFFADDNSRSCVESCPNKTLEYADDVSQKCVAVCPTNPSRFGQDLNDGNRTCVPTCNDTLFADPTTRTCVKNCNLSMGYYNYETDWTCQLECPTGYGNPNTGFCVATCPATPLQMFGDPASGLCVLKCPSLSYGNIATDTCGQPADCQTDFFADDSTNMCVAICPALQYTFGDGTSRRCVKACPATTYADNTTRLCSPTCNTTARLFKDASTWRCVTVCPSSPNLYANNLTNSCDAACTGGYYAYDVTRRCIPMCPSTPAYFGDQATMRCRLACPKQTYSFFNNTHRICVTVCPPRVFLGTNPLTVNLFADNSTWTCVQVCPSTPNYFAFAHPTDTNIRACVATCPMVGSTYYFADNMTRSCTTVCPWSNQTTYGDPLTHLCVKTCSRTQYRLNTTFRCVWQCPSPLFADNTTWYCVSKCPNNTFAMAAGTNRTCVKNCPTGSYAQNKTWTCIPLCQASELFWGDNTTWKCVRTCPTTPDMYADPNSQTCVYTCTATSGGVQLYANAGTRSCVVATSCGSGLVADPTTKRCISKCPIEIPLYKDTTLNLCIHPCTGGLFSSNSTMTCVPQCPSAPSYFGDNSDPTDFKCVQYCPATYYKHTPNRMCVLTCPGPDHYKDNLTMSCVTTCPDNYYADANGPNGRECLLACSGGQFADDLTKTCVAVCPIANETYGDTTTFKCVKQCKFGEYAHNDSTRLCGPTCNSAIGFADPAIRMCVSLCSSLPMLYADGSVPTDQKCVRECPPTYFALRSSQVCVQDCPTSPDVSLNMFRDSGTKMCLSRCLQGKFGDNLTRNCETGCTAPNLADNSTNLCVAVCPINPDYYGWNGICYHVCPDATNKYAENSTRVCVDICPNQSSTYVNKSWADPFLRRCVAVCSGLTYAYSSPTENICVARCPDTDGYYADQATKTCVTSCPDGFFAENTTATCVRKCPTNSYADWNLKMCVLTCDYSIPEFADPKNNNCTGVCPEVPSLYAQESNYSCVPSCEPTFFALNTTRICTQSCPDPYFNDVTSGNCVLFCPINVSRFADNDTRTCSLTCPTVTVLVGGVATATRTFADSSTKKCVFVCPSIPALYGKNLTNQCVSHCDVGTYGDNDTRLCQSDCTFLDPKFTYKDTTTDFCVYNCPAGWFADNSTISCSRTCPDGTFADNSTWKCVFICPINPSMYSVTIGGVNLCVYNCPDPLFADDITRQCVPTCPTTPEVYLEYTPTRKCVLECIYPYFAQMSTLKCVLNCSYGQYGNLTTHVCQACAQTCTTCQAELECTSCRPGYMLYNLQCVYNCPTYPVMYYAFTQSATCVTQCPSPYFSFQPTGQCQLSCPEGYYTDNVNNTCQACPTGCQTCTSNTTCQSCITDYLFVSTFSTCSKVCNSTHIYYFNGECLTTCIVGTYLLNDLVTCQSCSAECAACSGVGTNCTLCSTNFLYNARCIDNCPSDFYVDINRTCQPCSSNPSACILPPLNYTIKAFTENYQLNAYVIFNRPVTMTISEFKQYVQIKRNGRAVKSDEFKASVFNETTYLITFLSDTVNEEVLDIRVDGQYQMEVQTESLNIDQLTITFPPGVITDANGNALTTTTVVAEVEDTTGITPAVLNVAAPVGTAVNVISWVTLGILILFLIKGGYPILLTIEAAQIIYMHIFLLLDPIPYLEFTFLNNMKYFHFIFFPSLFDGILGGYSSPATPTVYKSFLNDATFLRNCSAYIVVFVIAILLFVLFKMLASRVINRSKGCRKVCHAIYDERIRISIINDAFWITYLYTCFFAMFQFKYTETSSPWQIVNIVFCSLTLLLYISYTIFMLYLGFSYRTRPKELPKYYAFLTNQPSSSPPLELPLRYLRKFLLCCALLVPSIQGQLISMMALNFCFFIYILFFKPSDSKLTNFLTFLLELFYIGLEVLFLIYFNVKSKTAEAQYGFGLFFCIAQGVAIVILLLWTSYRAWMSFKDITAIKQWLTNIENAKDFEELKKEQQKRDLSYDFGVHENMSQEDRTENADEIIEGFGRHVIPKNKPKIIRDNISDADDHKEKFNILDVQKIRVKRKEDDILSEQELRVKNTAGRVKKNNRGELVIQVREEELLRDPVPEIKIDNQKKDKKRNQEDNYEQLNSLNNEEDPMRKTVSSLKSFGQRSLISRDDQAARRPRANWDNAEIDLDQEQV